MTENLDTVTKWISNLAQVITDHEVLPSQYYNCFLQDTALPLKIIEIIANLDEEQEDQKFFSACIFALELGVSQLQSNIESKNKAAQKNLDILMSSLSDAIMTSKHSLSFWLPVLNAFYEAKVELSEELKNAYFALAHEDESLIEDSVDNLQAIRDLLHDLADLSVYDVAEYIFAQTYAMPAEFFLDLLFDLYTIDEGREVALLLLMHPKAEVREIICEEFHHIIENYTLTSEDLNRLDAIKIYYPLNYQKDFNKWIKAQRKKGVIFNKTSDLKNYKIHASEIDGVGAEGIFVDAVDKRKHRICGILVKKNFGIKEAWVTPYLKANDVSRYYKESFADTVMLREVDKDFFTTIVNHFLALTLELGNFPNLHLLEIQELTGIQLYPEKIDTHALIEKLSVEICPFTTESLRQSLKRTSLWPKTKQFTESWYLENSEIDRLVNLSCSFVDGTKVCNFDEAQQRVFEQYLEPNREFWKFHFLWTAMWLKVKSRKNEKTWQDCLCLAYAIDNGASLDTLPIMQEICYESLVNSMETMQERRTHLN